MTATAVSSSSSQFFLRMDLEFTQKRDTLQVASARRLELAFVQVDYRDQHHSNARASADDIYAQIASDCDKSIAAAGPCKIDRIYLNTNVAEQNGPATRVFTRGSANFFLVREEEGRASLATPPDNAREPG
ncbi:MULTISPECIES: hypothetical protein [Mesorhizobium]|uniref:hypothetical protein n=1 Tax=Mesorhizobium TaxID=68287 RepID=UPI0010A96F23|nr:MULTISPECIES: hypothetical protein [Mesorhizobium]